MVMFKTHLGPIGLKIGLCILHSCNMERSNTAHESTTTTAKCAMKTKRRTTLKRRNYIMHFLYANANKCDTHALRAHTHNRILQGSFCNFHCLHCHCAPLLMHTVHFQWLFQFINLCEKCFNCLHFASLFISLPPFVFVLLCIAFVNR